MPSRMVSTGDVEVPDAARCLRCLAWWRTSAVAGRCDLRDPVRAAPHEPDGSSCPLFIPMAKYLPSASASNA